MSLCAKTAWWYCESIDKLLSRFRVPHWLRPLDTMIKWLPELICLDISPLIGCKQADVSRPLSNRAGRELTSDLNMCVLHIVKTRWSRMPWSHLGLSHNCLGICNSSRAHTQFFSMGGGHEKDLVDPHSHGMEQWTLVYEPCWHLLALRPIGMERGKL